MTRSDTLRRVVVVGGYGNFGTRICRALAKAGYRDLWVAGRDIERAKRLAAELRSAYPQCVVDATELDCFAPDLVQKLSVLHPTVVVHTAGPFQAQSYGVANACIECRSHYVDLADARRFVADFGVLDGDARRRDVLLVSGASTLPGVSSAVIEELRKGLASVTAIETSIAPAGRTARGAATLAAVLSYCGKPFQAFENGTWITRHGWLDSRLNHYGSFTRRVAACDVPDLELFPPRYGAQTVTFHAGPESSWQLAILRFMATLARAGVVRDWSRYAGMLEVLDSWVTRFGSETGAMQIRVRGTNAHGESIVRTWDLIAAKNHGPQIPCVPAIVLAKRMLDGEVTERGALACIGVIDFGDLAAELAEFDIHWQVNEEREKCSPPT